jgi:tRNA pseudouridine38-40 synthase
MSPHQRARNAIQCNSRSPLPNTYRFAIRFAYDGTGFHGYQSQADEEKVPTIQDAIESRLRKLLSRNVRVLGWGRTDVGVHASGAVCTVDLGLDEVKRLSSDRRIRRRKSDIRNISACHNAAVALTNNTDCDEGNKDEIRITWEDELNEAAKTIQSALKEFKCSPNLPGSITARKCTPVPPSFDARFSCRWKKYVYIISCSKTRSPFLSRYSWQMDCMLDYDAMVQAANLLSGQHDFSWLSVIEPGDRMHPIRNLSLVIDRVYASPQCPFSQFGDADVDEDTETSVMFKISATCDFFLYKMMRRIVGALVAIGNSIVHVNDLESCIQLHDEAFHKCDDNSSDISCEDKKQIEIPKGLLQTAPANGLTLDHVEYDIKV